MAFGTELEEDGFNIYDVILDKEPKFDDSGLNAILH